MPNSRIFGLEFENIILMFQIIEFVLLQSLVQKFICLILVFLGWNLRKLFSHLKSAPSNLSDCKFHEENKNVWIWNQKCVIRVIFCWNLKKDIVVFEISNLEFVKLQNIVK